MSKEAFSELEEQERMMKQMIKKEMMTKLESKIRSGDKKLINRLKNMLQEDGSEEIAKKYKF